MTFGWQEKLGSQPPRGCVWRVYVLKEHFIWTDIKKSHHLNNLKAEGFIYSICIHMPYCNFFNIH